MKGMNRHIIFLFGVLIFIPSNVFSQEKHLVGFGYSRLFFADYFYEEYSFLHDAKREGPINSFHLDYYKFSSDNHAFIRHSLSYTNKTKYSFINNRDGRYGTPSHVPLTVSITDNYTVTNLDYSFSINYCGKRKISPYIGLGFKIGNTILTRHNSKTEIAYFHEDPTYIYIKDSSYFVSSGPYKSSYYFSSFSLNSNQGFNISISKNIIINLSTFIDFCIMNNLEKIYSPSYFPAANIGFNTSITYKIKQTEKKITNGG